MPPRSALILAFDVGRKKTGIALGNRLTGGARPLSVIHGDSRRQLAAAAAFVREWQPALLLVGLPVHADGAPHAQTARARRFAAALHAAFALPVAFADERHSTRRAREVQKNGEVDDSAAAIILQQYLDKVK